MRKAKSIFQGKNEPVWVRPSCRCVMIACSYNLEFLFLHRTGMQLVTVPGTYVTEGHRRFQGFISSFVCVCVCVCVCVFRISIISDI